MQRCFSLCLCLVLVLGLAGIWRTARRGWPYVLCFIPAVYFTLLHVVFVGSIRYRQPAMLVLIVPAAGWLLESCRRTGPSHEPDSDTLRTKIQNPKSEI